MLTLAFFTEIQEDMSKMNSEAKGLWDRVEAFRLVEETSWKILSPLLNGTTSLSHVDGSMYSVQVPDMIYKEHAAEVNKVGIVECSGLIIFRDLCFGYSL